MTVIEVKETGTGAILPTEEGYYEEPGLEVNRGPVGYINVGDPDATLQALVTPGVVMEIYEDAVRKFVGIVEKRKRKRGVDGYYLQATFRDLGYHLLRATPCDPYTYSELATPITDRDAVKVNPWNWRIFNTPFSTTLDIDGNPAFADGVRIDNACAGLMGSKFIFTHRFEDDRLFRVTDLTGTPGGQARVMADNFDDEDIPSLQRIFGDTGYIAHSSPLRTIPLESGDPNVTGMGNLTNLTVVLVGQTAAGGGYTAPTVEATRNARAGAPTWAAVTLAENANWNGSGLTAWVGTITFAGAVGNSAALRILTGSTGFMDTNRIYWMRLEGDLITMDTGLGAMNVHNVYVDPAGLGGRHICVDDDFEGLSRADALERLRLTTLTNPATNPGPHWDIWVDLNQQGHFAHRRGSDLATEVSLDDDVINVLEHEQFAEDVAYQVICEGGGTGKGAYTITDKVDYTLGGLYSASHNPNDPSPLYGDLPRVIFFRDQGTTSRTELRRRGRAFLRDRLDPQDYYSLRFVTPGMARFFATGDSFPLSDDDLSLAVTRRVTGVKVTWSGGAGHGWDVTLGKTLANPASMMASQRAKLTNDQKAAILATANKGVGGPAVYCDATHYGRASFVIPDKVEVDRVLMTLRTMPWQIYSRGGDSELGGTSSGDGEAPFSVSVTESALNFPTGTPSGLEQFGTDFATGVSQDAPIDYVEALIVAFNDASNAHTGIMNQVRLVRHSDGAVVAQSNTSQTGVTDTPQDADDTVSVFWKVRMFAVGPGTIEVGETYRLETQRISTTGSAWDDNAGAIIDITYKHHHFVPIAFGIWQFDGDDGTGDGDNPPLYGVLRFAVDPVVDADGNPSSTASFLAAAHPEYVGDPSKPVRVTVDVMPYLRRDASGRVAPGEHEVVCLGLVTSNNAEGLSAVAVSTRLIAAEANG